MPEAGPLFDLLSHTVDAKGRSFVIHKLPSKHPICITEEDLLGYDFEDGEDQRGSRGTPCRQLYQFFTLGQSLCPSSPFSAMKTIPWLQKFSENAFRIDGSSLSMHASF